MTKNNRVTVFCLGNGHLVGLGGGLIRTLALTEKLTLAGTKVTVFCSPGAEPYFKERLPEKEIHIFSGFLSLYLPKNTLFGMMLYYLECLFWYPKFVDARSKIYCQSEYIWDVLPAVRYSSGAFKNIFVMYHHQIELRLKDIFTTMLGSILGQYLGKRQIKKKCLNVFCYEGPAGDEVEKLLEGFTNSITRVNNGIWLKNQLIGSSELPRNLEQLPWQKSVCFVGGLRPQKGLEVVTQMLETLTSADQHIRVIIIGRNPPDVCQRLSSLYPSTLIFTGPLPNKIARKIVSKCRLAFLPSTTEGFGIFALEALAEKTLTVAFPIKVLRQIFGDNLVYAKELNGSSLAETILALCNNEEEYASKKQLFDTEKFQNFIQHYSWDEVLNTDLDRLSEDQR